MEKNMAQADRYSLTELKAHWDKYWNTSGYRCLIRGVWHYDFSGKPFASPIDATKSEVILLRKHITFPEYLEKYGK